MASDEIVILEMHDFPFEEDMKANNVFNKRFLLDDSHCYYLYIRTIYPFNGGLCYYMTKNGMSVNTIDTNVNISVYLCFEI